MKTWKEYKKSFNEGTNPTDFQSAGKDQDLENMGKPFDKEGMNKSVEAIKDGEKNEREYQKRLHELMLKRSKSGKDDDPNTIDPTKGPEGSTPGGVVDQDEHDLIKGYLEKMDKLYEKELQDRSEAPVKTTSTMFIPDKNKQFSPREDEKDPTADRDTLK